MPATLTPLFASRPLSLLFSFGFGGPTHVRYLGSGVGGGAGGGPFGSQLGGSAFIICAFVWGPSQAAFPLVVAFGRLASPVVRALSLMIPGRSHVRERGLVLVSVSWSTASKRGKRAEVVGIYPFLWLPAHVRLGRLPPSRLGPSGCVR
eukprot:scaffold141378_cov31-Tisochrysis_lutea.AAC.1